MSSKMKVIQRTLPKKLQHHVPKKATKHRNTDKLSLKEQYLYHIAQDVNEPSQIKPIPPSYEYEIPSKKSKKQLVRDVQYLEKLCMKYSAIETPQLSKVVRHLPFLVAYNKERIHSDRSDESIPSTSSKRARKMDKGTEEVYDVEDFDNEDENNINEEELDQLEDDWEYYNTLHDPLGDEMYELSEKDAKAVEEIRTWRLSFE